MSSKAQLLLQAIRRGDGDTLWMRALAAALIAGIYFSDEE